MTEIKFVESNMECYICRHFDRLYIKGNKRYNATKYGYCRVHGKTVQIHEICEKFAKKLYSKKSNKAIRNYLNDLLTEISEVRKVLEEDVAAKKCKDCNACKHAYVRYMLNYQRHGELYCAENDSITVADNACEKWRKKREEEYDLSVQRLDEAEEDIKRLIMMFGDNV